MSKENSNNQQGNNTKQPSKNVNNQSTSINRRGRDTSNHKTKKHQPNKKKTRTYTSRQNNETKNNEQNSANELKGNENLKGGLNIARKVATGNIIGATKSALKFKGNKKVRNKKAADNGKKPAQVDERYMKRAKELFYGEMAAALGINFKDVELYIKDSVESKGAATH